MEAIALYEPMGQNQIKEWRINQTCHYTNQYYMILSDYVQITNHTVKTDRHSLDYCSACSQSTKSQGSMCCS